MKPTKIGALYFVACLLCACGGAGGGGDGDDGPPRANSPPVATLPGGPILGAPAAPIYYDATQGGTAFTDPDGDTLTYSLQFLTPSRGLVIQGTHVIGTLATPSVAALKIKAIDGYGGEGEQTFWFVVAGPEPGRPFLPPVEYVYDELLLSPPLPGHFASVKRIDTDPPENHVSNAGATLGRVLFYDKRLSATNTHACASCHQQGHGFATPDRFPRGVTNMPLRRNSMGLTNVRYNGGGYFSDQTAETLEAAVTRPIEDVHELGNSLTALEAKLAATDFYPALFTAAFGSPDVTRDRIAKALAQFLRSIISYQSTFDLAGGMAAPYRNTSPVYTDEQRRGADIFEWGCSRGGCHGANAAHTTSTALNTGLDAVLTDLGAGRGRFRPASLRNIAMTAPYMHDGRFATLREVIEHYTTNMIKTPDITPYFVGSGQLCCGLINPHLSEDQKRDLEAFLHALTDQAVLTDPRWSDPFPQ